MTVRDKKDEPGDDFFSGMFTDPQPFAMPPDEPVEVVGEVPWELRDDDTPPPSAKAKPKPKPKANPKPNPSK